MNPSLLVIFAPRAVKKQIYLVLFVLVVVVSLPTMAVFALGTSTLSFLLDSSPSSLSSATAIATQTVGLYQGAIVQGDTYAWGNCTYWVYYLRQQAGDPIPTTWGNAATWSFYAIIDGYTVDHTPEVGAIMQISSVDKGLGHVAYVTNVDSTTGDWTISEMNVEGLDIVDLKTYPPSAAASFSFIHDKTKT